MVIVDSSLASNNWFPFCCIGLFFPDEKVKLIDVLQGYIIKGLKLSKSFQHFIRGDMSLCVYPPIVDGFLCVPLTMP